MYLFSEEEFFIYVVNIILKSWGYFRLFGSFPREGGGNPPSQKSLDETLVGRG